MSKSTLNMVFNVAAVIQLLFGLLMTLISGVTLLALVLMVYGNMQLVAFGEEMVNAPPAGVTAFAGAILLTTSLLYLASAYGLFKRRSWEPKLYMVLLVLSVISILSRIFTTGFSPANVSSMFVLFVWGWIGYLIWTNQDQFGPANL